MDPALVATLLSSNNNNSNAPNNNAAPQRSNASTLPSQPNLPPNPYQLPQSNTASHAPSSTSATTPPSWPSSPSSSTSSLNPPDATTFGMHLSGPGGITISSGPNGDFLSFGGPNGINMSSSSGPFGNHMTTTITMGGVSNGVNTPGSGSISTQRGPLNTTTTTIQTGALNNAVTINGIPVDPNTFTNPSNSSTFSQSRPFNTSVNNIRIGNNVVTGPYDPYSNGTDWSAVHPSLWPDHIRQQYQQGMALGAQGMNNMFYTLNGMGMTPAGMGRFARPPKQKKKAKGWLRRR